VHSVKEATFQSMIGNFIGHEAVGIVQEVDSTVKDFKPGDRVAIPDASPFGDSMQARMACPTTPPVAV
jgi:threonine dehydrogenase-like Zn-dependent dehydrogenase